METRIECYFNVNRNQTLFPKNHKGHQHYFKQLKEVMQNTVTFMTRQKQKIGCCGDNMF